MNYLTPSDLSTMHCFDFDTLDNISDIAEVLGCEEEFVKLVLQYPSNFYERFLIPKKRRPGHRVVYEVKGDLKNLHKNILVSIAAKVEFPEYVQGFVSKRSIATHASLHLAKKYVLNLDIKDFFESIGVEKIVEVFKGLGCKEEIALIMAKLCTLNGYLVQGTNTSPILANLVCSELDKDLLNIGQDLGCVYSRYADDITFSGNKIPKKRLISQCLEKYGFALNPAKWKSQRRGESQYVTGLTVFDDVRPRLPKRMKRQLRQALYYMYKYGLENHFEKINPQDSDSMDLQILRIDGLIAFMYSIEPDCAYKFDMIWQSVLTKEGIGPSREPNRIAGKRYDTSSSIFSPESSEFTTQSIHNNS